MNKRRSREVGFIHVFCRKWGILPSEIVLLPEEDHDFDEQTEFDYEAASGRSE